MLVLALLTTILSQLLVLRSFGEGGSTLSAQPASSATTHPPATGQMYRAAPLLPNGEVLDAVGATEVLSQGTATVTFTNGSPIGDGTAEPPLANAFDWRSYNGTNWVTPVKNQGNCGADFAFCATGAVESKMMILTGNTNQPPDLSEQQIISCNNAGSDCGGGYLSAGYDFIQTNGVVGESVFPYKATDLPCQTFSNAQLAKISGYYYCGTNAASVKQALVKDGPVCVAMDAYTSLEFYMGGVYWGGGTYLGLTAC